MSQGRAAYPLRQLFGERGHGSLARRLVAIRWRAIPMVAGNRHLQSWISQSRDH